MRRFYQESWHGIPFTNFAHTHFFHLADAKFYSVFYEQLFRRYQTWDDLPETWRLNKAFDAAWLASRLRVRQQTVQERPLRVLSIGSGVGFMERMLIREMRGDIELYVNEPSTVCMKWLRRLIPADRIFIGQPPDCLSPDITYDMIYLSAVDYSIPQPQLEHTLEMLRYVLLPGGELVCLSASLLEEESPVASFVNLSKNLLRGVLHYIGIRRQQFWGWRRTREEYLQLFNNCGYKNVQEGWLDDGFNTYWIRGGVSDDEPALAAVHPATQGAKHVEEMARDAADKSAHETETSANETDISADTSVQTAQKPQEPGHGDN